MCDVLYGSLPRIHCVPVPSSRGRGRMHFSRQATRPAPAFLELKEGSPETVLTGEHVALTGWLILGLWPAGFWVPF